MPKISYRITVFISSPSDLKIEREVALDVIDQINHDIGSMENFHLIPLTWESSTFSSKGDYAQAVINRQIGDEYDIFLGMMAGKFGTPTPNFASGTEEEFNLALQRHRETALPEMAFLFSDALRRPSEINLSDYQNIEEFRKRIGSLGILYKTYQDETQLRLHLWRALVGLARKLMNSSVLREAPGDKNAEVTFDPLSNYHDLLANDSEVNALVLAQGATTDMGSTKRHLEGMAKILENANTVVRAETRRIAQSASMKKGRAIQDSSVKIAELLREVSKQFHIVLPKLHRDLQSALISTQRSLEIFASRGELTEEIVTSVVQPLSAMRQSMTNLAKALRGAHDQFGTSTPGGMIDIQARITSATLLDTALVIDAGIGSMEGLETSIAALPTVN